MSRCILPTLASLVLCTATPAAADWQTDLPTDAVSLDVLGVVELDASRLRLRARQAGDYVYVPSNAQLRRIDLGQARERETVIALGDGGLLSNGLRSNDDLNVCQVQRFDAQGRVRWQENLDERSRGISARCGPVAEDVAGNLWAADFDLYRLSGADGVRRDRVSDTVPDLDDVHVLIGDDRAAGVYASVRVFDGSQDRGGALSLGARGEVRWRWTDTLVDRNYTVMQRSARGDLLLIDQQELVVLDGGGSLRWRLSGRPDSTTTFTAGQDGRVLVHARKLASPSEVTLTLLDPDGNALWESTRTPPTGTRSTGVDVRYVAGAGALVYERFALIDGSAGLGQLERLDADGRSLWRVDARGLTDLVLRADGSVWARDQADLVQFAAIDGARTQPTLSVPADASAELLELAADGTTAVGVGSVAGAALHVLSADGRLRWRTPAAVERVAGVGLSTPGRVCALRTFSGGARFDCHRAEDGSLLWQRQVATGQSTGALAYLGHVDGRQSALLQIGSFVSSTTRLALLGADGQLLLDRVLPGAAVAWSRFHPDGSLLLAVQSPSYLLQRVSAEGAVQFSATTTALQISRAGSTQGAPLRDGESLLLAEGLDQQRQELLLLGSDGAVRWRQPLTGYPFPGAEFEVIESGADLWIGGTGNGSLPQPGSTPLLHLRRSDGAVLWGVTAPSLEQAGRHKSLTLDVNGAALGFLTALRDSYEYQLYAASDGRLLEHRVLPFLPGQESVLGRRNAVGQARVLSTLERVDGLRTARVSAVDQFAGRDQRSLDRVARSGAWFDGSSGGQGWLLDVIPSARTIYAAWFTYEQREGAPLATPARLRWYSLQGTYAAGAESMTLDILENAGGVFSAPPATTARRVGTATLRFDGCRSGVLEYRFDTDENEAYANRVALRALAIRDPGCPAVATPSISAGFHGGSSGAWFDPATGGQGLVGVVQPPQEGRAGLLFAGWFHYDPAGSADDPRQQAWLTLQGELPATASGSAELGIFRTLGGQLAGPGTANTTRMGTATVQFQGCDRMRLDYRFHDDETAMPYRGGVGTQQLQKIGGCTPATASSP